MKPEQTIDLFSKDKELITKWITEIINEEYKNSVMRDMILPFFTNKRGKKLRPLISLFSFRMIAGEDADTSKIKPLCAALEISHNASLIVDDIFDRDMLRRGEESFYIKFGTFAALSGAYNLSAFVFDLATRTENHNVVREVGRVGTALSSALFLSKDLISKKIISREFFMDVLFRKTTALFKAAAKCGALIATDDENIVSKLTEFGIKFGTAYQLRDDVLGIVGTIEDLGKLPNSDIENRFQSLITIEAMERGTEEEIRVLKEFYLENKPYDIEVIRSILVSTGAIDIVVEKTEKIRDEAIAILSEFPDSTSKLLLIKLTQKINFDNINREFDYYLNKK